MRTPAAGSRVARRGPGRASRRRALLAGELVERGVEQRRPGGVERVEGLVGRRAAVVQENPAEPEPLLHPARERRDAVVAHLPETEPLEQHPDPLAPLRQAVEPPEEMEVLERRQLAVNERLVTEVADLAAFRQLDLPSVGASSPASTRSSVVLPEPFGPVTSRKSPRSSWTSTRGRRACRRSAWRDLWR